MHKLHRVMSFKIVAPHVIELAFEDGLNRRIDFHPVLKGELFSPLLEMEFFNKVRLDPDAGTLVWPNGADFDPAMLHDWPEHLEAWERMTEQWSHSVV